MLLLSFCVLVFDVLAIAKLYAVLICEVYFNLGEYLEQLFCTASEISENFKLDY